MALRFGQAYRRFIPQRPLAGDSPLPLVRAREVGFVICGVEHSGTTLVSDLFRQVPGVDSGLETGVLLASSPRAFPLEMPFAAHILDGWGITREELENCCDTDDFNLFYARIGAASRSIEPECKSLFDKTPRYLAHLEACMIRAAVPFIVTYKDPRSIVFSDFTRSGATEFDAWFDSYSEAKLGYLQLLYTTFKTVALTNDRVFCMALEELCMQPRKTCEAMFAHCGQVFRLNYLLFKKLRYHHTRSNSISPSIPLEYLDGLQPYQMRKIEKTFSVCNDWFYD